MVGKCLWNTMTRISVGSLHHMFVPLENKRNATHDICRGVRAWLRRATFVMCGSRNSQRYEIPSAENRYLSYKYCKYQEFCLSIKNSFSAKFSSNNLRGDVQRIRKKTWSHCNRHWELVTSPRCVFAHSWLVKFHSEILKSDHNLLRSRVAVESKLPWQRKPVKAKSLPWYLKPRVGTNETPQPADFLTMPVYNTYNPGRLWIRW